ncbi:MAG: aromatic ring-opening dioxygenase subunit LigA [Alphaproteobacteria bacterium]|nr:aromatic ring-opening dioxygenase subunit LigA [Alphaproteobacteria bacterium]
MSLYQVQKLIRQVNRNPADRESFKSDRASFSERFELTPEEREAVIALDMGALYAMGVHALLLRPFTILHGVSEPDYLDAIRAHRAEAP